MRNINWLLGILMLVSTLANAAIPPIDDDEREFMADAIVEGIVESSTEYDVQLESGGVNRAFTKKIRISRVIKSRFLTSNDSVWIKFWQAVERPGDCCGDQGQNSNINVKDRVRVYLFQDQFGEYQVINPNGLHKLR